MEARRVTLHHIAARLGVSHTTVALALRNHHRISAKRREQVKRLARQMGYQPDPFLSGLAAYRKQHGQVKFQGVIAWINHWNEGRLRGFGEFEAYWRGASRSARQFGYRIEEIEWPRDCSAKRFERILLTRGILGVLIPPHHQKPDWDDFDWNKFSIIRFGLSVPCPDSNLVTADQSRAVVMAVKRICEYGYQRIGLVDGEEFDRALGGNFYGGFSWAQKLFRLRPVLPPFLTNRAAFLKDPGKELQALKRWLTRHQPEALLTTEIQLPEMLRLLGYRIPQDIAVAGTSVLDVPVDAGIDQHSESIGRIAVEMLVKQFNVNERGEPPAPCRILVEGTWRDGKSLPKRRNV